jgi:preprotein translocase subunit SecG
MEVMVLIAVAFVVVGLVLAIIGREAKKRAGGISDRKGARLAKIGSWMAGTGAIYGLLSYFFGIRGGTSTVSVKARLLITIIFLIVGYVLMRLGQKGQKRAGETPNRNADLTAEVGYWIMAAGCAYLVLYWLFWS